MICDCALLLMKFHVDDVLISFALLFCFFVTFFLSLPWLVEGQLRDTCISKDIGEFYTKFGLSIVTDAVEKNAHQFHTGVNRDLLCGFCTL